MATKSKTITRVGEDSPTPCAVLDLARRQCLALLTMGGLPLEHPIAAWCIAAFGSVGSGDYPTSPPELNALGAELEADPEGQSNRVVWLGVRLALRCSVALRSRTACQCALTALERELTEEMALVLSALPAAMLPPDGPTERSCRREL